MAANDISLVHTKVTLEFGPNRKHEIKGWAAESDALMMPSEEEYETVTWGADGDYVTTRKGMQGGEIAFKLLPNSPSAVFLNRLYRLTLPDGGNPGAVVRVLTCTIEDTLKGFKYLCEYGSLTKGPRGLSIGDGAVGVQAFTFTFKTIIPQYDDSTFRDADSRDTDFKKLVLG